MLRAGVEPALTAFSTRFLCLLGYRSLERSDRIFTRISRVELERPELNDDRTRFGGSGRNRTDANCLRDSRSSLRATEPILENVLVLERGGFIRTRTETSTFKRRLLWPLSYEPVVPFVFLVISRGIEPRFPDRDSGVVNRWTTRSKTLRERVHPAPRGWMGSQVSNLEREVQSLERCHTPLPSASRGCSRPGGV